MTEVEEKARAEAQARRQRILEKSTDRMDVVTGRVGIVTSSDEGGGGGEGGESPTSESGGGAARLAAMRRRRYQNKKKKAAAEGEAKKAEAEPTATAVADDENKKPDSKDDNEVVEEINTPGVEAEEKTKKKYMGVAKMRRKMLAEKKQQQQQEPSADAATSPTADSTKKKKKKHQLQVNHTIPILMHAFVVILLFVAGLEVGLQQGINAVESGVLVKIETGLAPREELHILRLVPKSMRPALGMPLALEEEKTDQAETATKEEEEFADATVDTTPVKESNIDPLFGLDLDQITAGPGVLNLLGRYAVKAHRVNLAIFYYLPRRLVDYCVTTAQQLVVLPPVLFLIALVLRQVVGHVVLGAKLPEKVVEDESQHKDVVNMVKNFVQGFVLKSFPTAASMYDAWVHIRADMYVVLCGLLVGLLWTYQLPAPPAEGGERDEL